MFWIYEAAHSDKLMVAPEHGINRVVKLIYQKQFHSASYTLYICSLDLLFWLIYFNNRVHFWELNEKKRSKTWSVKFKKKFQEILIQKCFIWTIKYLNNKDLLVSQLTAKMSYYIKKNTDGNDSWKVYKTG